MERSGSRTCIIGSTNGGGDNRFRDAALNWYGRLLTMFRPNTGFGGYSMRAATGPDGTAAWEPWPGFLDGSIGIALALLAAVTPIEPCWDRLILLSSPLDSCEQNRCQRR